MENDLEYLAHEYMKKLLTNNERLQAENEKLLRVVIDIANDYVELSHDKSRMQNLDHIKWANAVLKEIRK